MKKLKSHQFNSKSCLYSHTLIVSVYVFILFSGSANGQISTPCTTSMISTFTPCMNYVTGSSYNGTLPTTECCNSLKTIIIASIDCACLIVTANVPLPTTGIVSQALSVSLPSFCNSPAIPIRCQATGSPLPSPGPVLFAPPPPPSAITPTGSAAPTSVGIVAGPQVAPKTTGSAPAASPVGVEVSSSKTSTGQIPILTSPFGSSPSCTVSYPVLVSLLVMMMVLKLY